MSFHYEHGYSRWEQDLIVIIHVFALAGLLLLTEALSSDASAPVMHLRTVNSYVAAALEDWPKGACITARTPRQSSGGILSICGSHDGNSQLAGTSSFGMSGVNAHALMCRPISSQKLHVSYRRQHLAHDRYWTSVLLHPLLQCAIPVSGQLLLQSELNNFNLAYLSDHQVITFP